MISNKFVITFSEIRYSAQKKKGTASPKKPLTKSRNQRRTEEATFFTLGWKSSKRKSCFRRDIASGEADYHVFECTEIMANYVVPIKGSEELKQRFSVEKHEPFANMCTTIKGGAEKAIVTTIGLCMQVGGTAREMEDFLTGTSAPEYCTVLMNHGDPNADD